MQEDDAELLRRTMRFMRWMETSGRYGRLVMWLMLAIFGASVTIGQVWDYWLSRIHRIP